MEYFLHKNYANKDFVPSKIADAERIVIQEDNLHPFIQVIGKDNKSIMRIALEKVKDTKKIPQKQYKEVDSLLQIAFTDETKRLRLIRFDISDSEIDQVYSKINNLRELSANDINNAKSKVCSKCGAHSSLESKFCDKCGHKLELACPGCGNLNTQKSVFCPNCALKLKN